MSEIPKSFRGIKVNFLLTYLLSSFLFSCGSGYDSSTQSLIGSVELNADSIPVRCAEGFTIRHLPDYTLLEVLNPWQGARQVVFRYALVDRSGRMPDKIPEGATVIRTPVQRVVCTSTTHIALLEMLDELDALVGVSGAGLITQPEVRKKLAEGKIKDIGYDRNLNYETLVALKPDMVIMYGIESEVTGYMNKIRELGIPVVMNGEYLEKKPLAKLEWVRFVAAFFQKENLAVNRFDTAVSRYNHLKNMCSDISVRPVVMTGLPWKEVWYVSAGNTTLATYIQDAGGVYLWQDITASKAVPMDIETVFSRSSKADYWINTGTAGSKQSLLQTDKRFTYFRPVIKDHLYNNTARVNDTGGNDYWESGLTHPENILSDLISILHPELLPGHELIYYRKLQ